jgi:hypothetical protein
VTPITCHVGPDESILDLGSPGDRPCNFAQPSHVLSPAARYASLPAQEQAAYLDAVLDTVNAWQGAASLCDGGEGQSGPAARDRGDSRRTGSPMAGAQDLVVLAGKPLARREIGAFSGAC